jgi:hypothetical protein
MSEIVVRMSERQVCDRLRYFAIKLLFRCESESADGSKLHF